MRFSPKFSSFRSRIAMLAVVLWIDAFIVLRRHRITAAGIVILATAAVLAAAIPESPGKPVTPEKYDLTGGKP